MDKPVDASILSQELEPLNAQIEETRKRLVELEAELRVAEEEVESFAAESLHFNILRETCAALEQLENLGAGELFWDGLPKSGDPAQHLERLRGRIAAFEEETGKVRELRDSLQAMVDQHLEELDYLFDEVHQAHVREEQRQEEFLIEREVSSVPYRRMVMPWTKEGESEKRFRRILLVALLWTLVFGLLIPMVSVPILDRTTEVPPIPERLAMLVKKEPPAPAPKPKPRKETKPADEPEKPAKTAEPTKTAKAGKGDNSTKKATAQAPPQGGGGSQTARAKAETTGVLAFKSSFSDLMDEVPVARLGSEARLNKKSPQVAGQARARRSLVAMQAQNGTSGGIGNFGVSTNLGNGGKGGGTGYGRGGGFGNGNGTGSGDGNGVGFGRVESAISGLEETGRPLSDGPGPGRTDEEIQIVFDRYKATLYRIYNRKLREDPTLRGKLLLRLIIEPNGEVSLCKAESTDLASPELVAQIVARVKRFNFGPKEGVPKTTILYPIDFLPAG